MTTIELSDPDGDALTITKNTGGIWVTCTAGAAEVTVGPFPVDSLLVPLARSGRHKG